MMRLPPLSTLWSGSFWTLVLITLWLSLIPADQVPSAFHFWDKAQHALGFAGLAFLGLMAYPDRIRLLMFGLMLFGAGIECAHQLFCCLHNYCTRFNTQQTHRIVAKP